MTMIILIVLAVLLLVALGVSGKLSVLAKGFANIFVEDLAKTPDGADAIYQQAIEEKQTSYNKADDNLRRVAGQLSSYKEDLVTVERQIKGYDEKCDRLAKNAKSDNDWNEIAILAEARDSLMDEQTDLQENIAKVAHVYEEAKMLHANLEKQLINLKDERKRVVNNLKMNKEINSMYDDMNELKKSGHLSQLIGAVKDAEKESRQQVQGAKEVYQNKTSTKITRIEEKAKKQASSEYLDGLKQKYGNNN